MFSYFPKNYVWNLSVDIAIESGAQIGEIEEMCAPLREAPNRVAISDSGFHGTLGRDGRQAGVPGGGR